MFSNYLITLLLVTAGSVRASEFRPIPRQDPPLTTCTASAIAPVPSGAQCGVQGTLTHPNELKPPFKLPESSSGLMQCSNDCLAYTKCLSFSFNSGNNSCTLYRENLHNQGIESASKMNSTVYYNRNCFATSCGPTSTCPTQTQTQTVTSTVTSTATITATNSTPASSSSTSTPTSAPGCMQAAASSGNCGYAADYNGGTTPQLWAGAASSLDACALLCAGEPGCLSLAYNPGRMLQCVLFSSTINGLNTNSDASSSTTFYDSTCFTCSGSAPLPPTDDSCTPALNPSGICDLNAFYGIPIYTISSPDNTASSLGACMQQCLGQSMCESISFDGTDCILFSTGISQLEAAGVASPAYEGVAGASSFYDKSCLVCPTRGCVCSSAMGKRDLVRREAGVQRREAELERRMLAVEDRERRLGRGK